MSIREDVISRIIDRSLRDIEINISGNIEITVKNSKSGKEINTISVPVSGNMNFEKVEKEK